MRSPAMAWPAMSMGFQVEDKMLFDQLAVCQEVDLKSVQGPEGYVVTRGQVARRATAFCAPFD